MTRDPRIRVTFVVPDLEIGGAERHVVTLVERLDPARFEARVVCLGRPGAMFAQAAAAVPAVALGHTKAQAARSVWALAHELRAHRADIVVLRGYSAETVGRVAAVLARVPRTVVWVHNSFDLAPRGRVRAVVDRVLEPVTDAYFGVSTQQLPYLTEELGHPAEKVHIIHNGVDVASFAPRAGAEADPGRIAVRRELGMGDDDVVVGIFAGLRPEKDHELFLRAASLVAVRCPEARFVLVGDGPCRPVLEKLAGELGIADRVLFTGFRDDVPDLLRAVDVVALTSWSEAFPMSLLEAMAAARPIVGTDVGGVCELVEEGVTGLLAPARDTEAVAARLVELVEDPERRTALGSAGQERVRREYSLERSVSRTEHELSALLGGRTTSGGSGASQPVRLTMLMDETGIGGVELVTLTMFAAFDRALVQPHLVVLRAEGPLEDEFRAIGVPVDVLDRRGKFDWRTLPRLVWALRRHRTDAVLLAHHHRASLALGRIAALLAGVRVVVLSAHGMNLAPLGQRVLPRSAVRTLRWTSALVSLAPSQESYLRREEGVGARPWSRTREVVIANGIAIPPPPDVADRERARAALALPEEAYVVGIVARLAEEKAHEVLIRAVAELVATHAHARLVVVGGGDRDAELRALVDELGIGDHVHFLGVRRDVPALLPAFDVSCLCSKHEAAPIGVIEAMAAGLPVVATAAGALPDMVGDGREGILVPVGDSHRLAAALAELADDPERRRTMGLAARNRVERDFSIEETARRYESLLGELVGVR